MITHTQPPTRRGRPIINTGPCANCQLSPAATHGLCKQCDSYLRETGKDRPLELAVALNEKRATRTGRCLCGEYATTKIKTNLGKMDVCPACAALEARQAAGVWEA